MWLAAHIADLTPDLQVLHCPELPLTAVILIYANFFLMILGLPGPCVPPTSNVGLNARKPVFRVSVKANFKPVSSATEPS